MNIELFPKWVRTATDKEVLDAVLKMQEACMIEGSRQGLSAAAEFLHIKRCHPADFDDCNVDTCETLKAIKVSETEGFTGDPTPDDENAGEEWKK